MSENNLGSIFDLLASLGTESSLKCHDLAIGPTPQILSQLFPAQ